MSSITNFKINDFLSLKFENGETVIYVKGDRFSICKHLVLNIPIDKISFYGVFLSFIKFSLEYLKPIFSIKLFNKEG